MPCEPPQSFDCWELVREVRQKLGLPTPAYVERQARSPRDRDLIASPPAGWTRLLLPTLGCVVRIGDKHVGAYLNNVRVMHAQAPGGVRIDTMDLLGFGGVPTTCWEYRHA